MDLAFNLFTAAHRETKALLEKDGIFFVKAIR